MLLTSIPRDIGNFASIETSEVYDETYWRAIAKGIGLENRNFEKLCEMLQPTQADMQRQFTI